MVENIWVERGVRVTKVAILCRRDVIRRLHKVRPGRQEEADMAAFAPACNTRMHVCDECRRGKPTERGAIVAHAAVVNRGNMVNLLIERDDAVMTGSTVAGNPGMVVNGSRKGVGAHMTD